jgi:hypothetical protein
MTPRSATVLPTLRALVVGVMLHVVPLVATVQAPSATPLRYSVNVNEVEMDDELTAGATVPMVPAQWTVWATVATDVLPLTLLPSSGQKVAVELSAWAFVPPRIDWLAGQLTPFVPVAPVAPTSPVAPVAPRVPVAPAAPVGPVGPVEPTEPVSPVPPVAPAFPFDPVAPVGPAAPVGPCGPTPPVIPVAPVAPLAPVAPVAPVSPVGPAGPVGPVPPVAP